MAERLPKGSCDAHLHVFGNPREYPVANPNALYQPPQDCNFAAMVDLHQAISASPRSTLPVSTTVRMIAE